MRIIKFLIFSCIFISVLSYGATKQRDVKANPEKSVTVTNTIWTDNSIQQLKSCIYQTTEVIVTNTLQKCIVDSLTNTFVQLTTDNTPQGLQACFSKEGGKCDTTQSTTDLTSCLSDKLSRCAHKNVIQLLDKESQYMLIAKVNGCFQAQQVELVTPLTDCLTHNATTSLVVVSPSSTTHNRTDYPPDIQKIIDRGELVIGMLSVDSPPFFFVDKKTGQLDGLDIKIANEMAQKLGVKLRLDRSAKTFDGVVDLVVSNEVDIGLSKLSRTLERSKRVLFSEPYIIFHHGLLINRLRIAQLSHDKNPYENISTISDKIAVIQSSSYADFARQKFLNAEVVEYPKWQDVVTAVLNGSVVAAYRDELEIKRAVFGNSEAALKIQTAVLTDTEDAIAIAINHQNSHLLFWLNQFLKTLNLHYNADELLREYPEILN